MLKTFSAPVCRRAQFNYKTFTSLSTTVSTHTFHSQIINPQKTGFELEGRLLCLQEEVETRKKNVQKFEQKLKNQEFMNNNLTKNVSMIEIKLKEAKEELERAEVAQKRAVEVFFFDFVHFLFSIYQV